VRADPDRPLEFLRLRGAGRRGVTLSGSGTTTVTTAPLFRGRKRVLLDGAVQRGVRPGRRGRIRFAVDLGPPSGGQEYRPGVQTRRVTRAVSFHPRGRKRHLGPR
jgi:hypothetical protein